MEENAHRVTRGFAFLCGALVGAVAALLLAPQAGRETRRDLRQWVDEGREKLGTLPGRASELADRAGGALDRAVERGRGVVEKGRELVREQRQAPGEEAGTDLAARRVPRGPRHTA